MEVPRWKAIFQHQNLSVCQETVTLGKCSFDSQRGSIARQVEDQSASVIPPHPHPPALTEKVGKSSTFFATLRRIVPRIICILQCYRHDPFAICTKTCHPSCSVNVGKGWTVEGISSLIPPRCMH